MLLDMFVNVQLLVCHINIRRQY